MRTWLPEGVPEDFMDWPIVHVEPRWARADNLHHHVNAQGPLAYETLWTQDGRTIEVREWLDGHQTRRWQRDPMDGILAFTWRPLPPLETTP